MKGQKTLSVRNTILLIVILLNILVLKQAYVTGSNWYWGLLFSMPLLFIAVWDSLQKKHALIRNYPIVGHLRYLFESIRPEMRQYFFESDLDGKPFNRRQRSIVYQRAKNVKQTVAFGMQADPNKPGYEWVAHSVFPVTIKDKNLRVKIGNHFCMQPYEASIFNIGAMSYGSLSKTAIASLNRGARLGGFAHNTGEGGISEYHLSGGDLIWQIGTGYFGCRNKDGRFDAMAYRYNALRPEVKMIELKLSQGAKPGHGGLLPASKNTPEIASIRGVIPGTVVHSPSAHSEFNTPVGLVRFLNRLRGLSDGKPVGFKICIGDKQEFLDICDAMLETGCIPDFITVDGAEGGTGAAPLEFTDHIGMPLHEALAFVRNTLESKGLLSDIKILAAGKIITAFDIIKALSMGASACYSSRGMMFALGCIQALICDSGRCPVGIATQDPSLSKALDPADKGRRIYNFHLNTMKATREMMEACGFARIEDIDPARFFKKINEESTRSFEQMYMMGSKLNLQTALN